MAKTMSTPDMGPMASRSRLFGASTPCYPTPHNTEESLQCLRRSAP